MATPGAGGPREGGSALPPASSLVAPEHEPQSWQFKLAQFFFLFLIFRLPWFALPCDIGTCSNPIDIVTIELYSYNRAPQNFIKLFVFPGAFMESFTGAIAGDAGVSAFPDWSSLLNQYQNVTMKEPFGAPFPWTLEEAKKQNVDLLLGSFFCLFGGVIALFNPLPIPTVGMMFLTLHLVRKSWELGPGGVTVTLYFIVSCFCSLAWIRFDLWIMNLSSSGRTNVARSRQSSAAGRSQGMESAVSSSSSARKGEATRRRVL